MLALDWSLDFIYNSIFFLTGLGMWWFSKKINIIFRVWKQKKMEKRKSAKQFLYLTLHFISFDDQVKQYKALSLKHAIFDKVSPISKKNKQKTAWTISKVKLIAEVSLQNRTFNLTVSSTFTTHIAARITVNNSIKLLCEY